MTAPIAKSKEHNKADTWSRFVDEYLKDFSPTHAYLRTYGGALVNAQKWGARLVMANAWISSEIRRKSAGRITLADITPERIALELARVAMFDVRKTVNTVISEDGQTLSETPIPLAMLDEDTARAVKTLKYDLRGNRVLEVADKIAALNTLAKISGVQPDPRTPALQAAKVQGSTTAEDDEIALMLADAEDIEDDEIDMGEDIEGEYAHDDE